jgi:hypothetical protein
MMQRRRILSIGEDAVYIEIYWDDPMQVEQSDETFVNGDPDATWLIHEVVWQNIYEPPTPWRLTLRHNTQPMSFPMAPGTLRTVHTFSPGQRPDMRDINSIALGTAPVSGGGGGGPRKAADPIPPLPLFATFIPSQHFHFKKRRK